MNRIQRLKTLYSLQKKLREGKPLNSDELALLALAVMEIKKWPPEQQALLGKLIVDHILRKEKNGNKSGG